MKGTATSWLEIGKKLEHENEMAMVIPLRKLLHPECATELPTVLRRNETEATNNLILLYIWVKFEKKKETTEPRHNVRIAC